MSIYRNVMVELAQAKAECAICHQVCNAGELHEAFGENVCQPCIENPTLK